MNKIYLSLPYAFNYFKFRRKIHIQKKSKCLIILMFLIVTTSFFLYTFGQHEKPYYLVDSPTYVFINNDQINNKLTMVVPKCDPYNNPKVDDFRVLIDGKYYPKIVPMHQKKIFNFTCLNSNAYKPIFLLWNRFQGLPLSDIPDGQINNINCPVTNCIITKDRSKLNESDYVLFYMRSRIDEFPRVRFSRQKWVYVIYESQQNCPMCSKLDDGLFNLSSTYRQEYLFNSI